MKLILSYRRVVYNNGLCCVHAVLVDPIDNTIKRISKNEMSPRPSNTESEFLKELDYYYQEVKNNDPLIGENWWHHHLYFNVNGWDEDIEANIKLAEEDLKEFGC